MRANPQPLSAAPSATAATRRVHISSPVQQRRTPSAPALVRRCRGPAELGTLDEYWGGLETVTDPRAGKADTLTDCAKGPVTLYNIFMQHVYTTCFVQQEKCFMQHKIFYETCFYNKKFCCMGYVIGKNLIQQCYACQTISTCTTFVVQQL